MNNDDLTAADTDAALIEQVEAAIKRDPNSHLPLSWEELEAGFDSTGEASGAVLILLYNNAPRLLTLARAGLNAGSEGTHGEQRHHDNPDQ